MRIVIPGGSGQVGNILARHFHAQGHVVTVLSRSLVQAPGVWRCGMGGRGAHGLRSLR
jgi:uncharacterized protein